jgi:adenylate cyclase
LLFAGRDAYNDSNDVDLRAALRQARNVALAGKIEPASGSFLMKKPLEDFGNIFFDVDSSIGSVNVFNDADGVIRRYAPFFQDRSTKLFVPAFSFAVLNKYFGMVALSTADNYSDEFEYEFRTIPKYDDASMLINFYGPSGTFRRIKFVDVIDDESLTTKEEEESGEEINTFSDPDYGYLHDGTFKDKIVLIGSTAPEEHDLFPVSFARGQREGDNLMYGVEIHANVIESVIREDFITKESTFLETLSILFFTIVTFLVTSGLKGSKSRHAALVELNGFLFSLAEVCIIGFASLELFTRQNYLLTTISPILAVLAGYVSSTVYHFVVERKQRLLIKAMFSTYVNPSVVEELIINPEKLKLGGERRELTVLFSDIEGFTTISEGMTPETLVGLLNEYLSAMTEIVFKNDGTLDKYEGDAVMAFWGAPIPQSDHALRACFSALQMQNKLASIRSSWQERWRAPLNIRVGINTGEMVVGNMGGFGKFDYTVIGDSVNLASRLEGANKQYRSGIIVSERTYELVKERLIGRELDLIAVKGRVAPLRIFELLGVSNGAPGQTWEEFLGLYTAGLTFYRSRNWKGAKKKFKEALALKPDDYPSQLYVERSSHYTVNPPPVGWNGVFVMQTK